MPLIIRKFCAVSPLIAQSDDVYSIYKVFYRILEGHPRLNDHPFFGAPLYWYKNFQPDRETTEYINGWHYMCLLLFFLLFVTCGAG